MVSFRYPHQNLAGVYLIFLHIICPTLSFVCQPSLDLRGVGFMKPVHMKFSRLYSFLVPRRLKYLLQYSLIFHLMSENSKEILL